MMLGPEGRKLMQTFGRVSTVGIELVLSTVLGVFGGRWLDTKLGTFPWLAVVGGVLGLVAGFRSLYRVARSLRSTAAKPTNDEKNDANDEHP